MEHSLLIITEAGEGIGFGHYTRMLAIKEYTEERGVKVTMLVDLHGTSYGRNLPGAETRHWLSAPESLHDSRQFTHLLIDSYLIPPVGIQMLKGLFGVVVGIDDYHRIDTGPDLIINPNVFGDKLNYTARAVGGKDYVILRKTFREEKRKLPIRMNAQNLLITLGGSDIRNLLPELLTLLLKSSSAYSITAIAGNNEYAADLREKFPAQGVDIIGHVNAEVMKEKMLATDLAISACGQTLHELAWLGVPTVGICVSEDQVLNMNEYVTLGFLSKAINWDDADFAQSLLDSLAGLVSSVARDKQSTCGKDTIRAAGVHNIFKAIFNE